MGITNAEFQQAKVQLQLIEDTEKLMYPKKIGTAWQVCKLDLEIIVMEYRLELKRIERASWD